MKGLLSHISHGKKTHKHLREFLGAEKLTQNQSNAEKILFSMAVSLFKYTTMTPLFSLKVSFSFTFFPFSFLLPCRKTIL